MLSIISIILKYKRTVAAVTAAGAVVSVVISLLIPPRYISSVSLLPAGVEEELSGSGSFFSQLGTAGEAYSDLLRVRRNFVISYIVESRKMGDMMSRRFSLEELYGTDSPEEVREELGERTHVDVREEGVIVISVEDSDPVRARDMAEGYSEYLDSILIGLNAESAESTRRYLEGEYLRRKRRVEDADSLMKIFLDENRIFGLEEQASAALEVLARIGARRSELEIEKRLLETSMKEGSPRLDRVTLELEKLEEQISSMMTGEDEGGLFPPLSEIPELTSKYISLAAERMMQEFAMAYVGVKLEDARISAQKRVSMIRIIDPPAVPGRRAWPKRKQIVIVLTLASFFWACLVLLAREQIREGRFFAAAQRHGPPKGGAAAREKIDGGEG